MARAFSAGGARPANSQARSSGALPERFRTRRYAIVFLVASVCVSRGARAQDPATYQAQRRRATELFQDGKRLEALPVLEQLVAANPNDREMLVDLAASLVDHAMLVDRGAAGAERLRARDLLEQARKLGDASALALNLLEILDHLPENGDIKFSADADVEQSMRAGEAAFSQRDFDEAIRNYSRALQRQPNNYFAALFTGNAYDRKGDLVKAAEWYERAIRFDRDIETAYRYYADMLARNGEMAEARAMLIQAAVAEPYNRIVWRELHAWAALNHTEINFVYAGIPPLVETGKTPGSERTGLSAAWDAYRGVREKWQNGGEFNRRFPEEKQYRHSLPEESEALLAAIRVLERVAAEKRAAELVEGDTGLVLLLNLHRADLVEPYVLFSLGDAGISRDYIPWRALHRSRLKEYLDRFVVPPVH
jgi:tetratricopeptide (TPR) repeat protein